MTIAQIAKLLDAALHCGDEFTDREALSACGCDMMSDALAFMKEQSVLLTGLINPQVVRTAEMMDVTCVVFVRGKKPTDEMIDLARERGLVLLSTNYRMFPACGILYTNGLGGGGKVG
jgi:predicted transcriptional regulator